MSEKSSTRKVREATHAGIFYPDDPALLASTISGLLEAQIQPGTQRALGIISPHASIEYSGDLSALAWKASAGREVARIVILAPLHRSTQQGIFLPESSLFDCPLGAMEVETSAIEDLMDCGTFYVINDIPHLEEHGIEVQLPFARTLHPEARIVPILLGKTSMPLVKSLAMGLRLIFGGDKRKTLFVISSDLAFAASPSESSRRSDAFLDLVLAASWERLVEADELPKICGAGCVAALFASGIAASAHLLGRHNADAERENEDEAWGEYAALALE